jgi:hypothetical protein
MACIHNPYQRVSAFNMEKRLKVQLKVSITYLRYNDYGSTYIFVKYVIKL